MTRHLALLRGVNVNGRTVRSADLAATVESIGGTAVRTVLASGNAAFDSDRDASELKPALEAALGERFGYTAWIVLVTQEALAAVARDYPFPRMDDEAHPYVVFGSSGAALDAALAEIGTSDVDLLQRGDGVVYWRCPKGSSTDTPAAKVLARAAYRSTTTTRNLRTVEKLVLA